MTAVQAVHLSRIGSLKAIEQARAALRALPPDGVAILNADDPLVRGWEIGQLHARRLRLRGRRRRRCRAVESLGLGGCADLQAGGATLGHDPALGRPVGPQRARGGRGRRLRG